MGLVKDDEALTDQGFCPLILRLEAVMSALGRVEKETGKKAFYAVSVTAGADRILERAEEAVDHGANMVMIDVLPAGFSSLEPLSQNLNVPIHVHRTLQGASARDKSHGISMLVIAKLVRMVEALTCIPEAAWARCLLRGRRTTCAATLCERNG